MTIQRINKYKELYLKYHKTKLSDQQALEMLLNLVEAVKLALPGTTLTQNVLIDAAGKESL